MRLLLACTLVALAVGVIVLQRTPRARIGNVSGQELGLPAPAVSSGARLEAPIFAPHAQPDDLSTTRVPATAEARAPAPHTGGWLHGRLTSARPFAWRGYRIGLTAEGAPVRDPRALARFAADARKNLVSVDDDGRFELGQLAAGLATVYLHAPGEVVWQSSGHGDGNRQGIGQVVIEDGVVLERDFEVAELPGQLVVEAHVNGVPEAGLELELRRDLGGKLTGLTDAAGRLGPVPLFAAGVRVQVSHPEQGWKHVHPLVVEVPPGEPVHALVAIEVVRARVHFTSRTTGEPLARRKVALLDAAGIPLAWEHATDGEGTATFALPLGEYRFALNPGDTPQFAIGSSNRSDVVQWTYQGPLVGRVRL